MTNDTLIKNKYLELKKDIIKDKSKTEELFEYIKNSSIGESSKSAHFNKQMVLTNKWSLPMNSQMLLLTGLL